MYLKEKTIQKIYSLEEGLKTILGGGLALGAMTALNPNLNPDGAEAFGKLKDAATGFGHEMRDSAAQLTHNALNKTEVGHGIYKFMDDAKSGSILNKFKGNTALGAMGTTDGSGTSGLSDLLKKDPATGMPKYGYD